MNRVIKSAVISLSVLFMTNSVSACRSSQLDFENFLNWLKQQATMFIIDNNYTKNFVVEYKKRFPDSSEKDIAAALLEDFNENHIGNCSMSSLLVSKKLEELNLEQSLCYVWFNDLNLDGHVMNVYKLNNNYYVADIQSLKKLCDKNPADREIIFNKFTSITLIDFVKINQSTSAIGEKIKSLNLVQVGSSTGISKDDKGVFDIGNFLSSDIFKQLSELINN